MSILIDDIFDILIDKRIKDIDLEIKKLTNKINHIRKILNPLKIEKYSDNSYIIKYDYINYCLNSYLYEVAVKGKVFIIYPGYMYEHNSEYISDLLINPTYFTILLEANKNYYKFKDYNNNKMINLNYINNFDEYKCKIYRIMLSKDITYIELIFN
tara:strand:- start:564 stop:1031 length:468 start_codon:yes stop_codon:yes gene_type:complete